MILFLGGTTSNILLMIALALAIFVGLFLLTGVVSWIRGKPWEKKKKLQKAIDELRRVIEQASGELTSITDPEASLRPSPEKWSRKEILGHLIDSASNNHQRFVRAQLSAEIKLPAYDQESWVKMQSYQNESWENLVNLWKNYNLHLLHVVSSIREDVLSHYCFIGEGEPVTLEYLIRDYVSHLTHHIDQILE